MHKKGRSIFNLEFKKSSEKHIQHCCPASNEHATHALWWSMHRFHIKTLDIKVGILLTYRQQIFFPLFSHLSLGIVRKQQQLSQQASAKNWTSWKDPLVLAPNVGWVPQAHTLSAFYSLKHCDCCTVGVFSPIYILLKLKVCIIVAVAAWLTL